MRLLFITQKLKEQDAFGVLWIREFLRQGFEVTVICLEGSNQTFEFPVHSLGKEVGASKLLSILRFEKLIATLEYDRVFVHMAPVWYALGFWLWKAKRVPTYLWYTHYTMQLGVRLFDWFGTRFFCATTQSLPQFAASPKKTVVGHGIDLAFWPRRPNACMQPHRLLVVHRLSRSKRLELSIRALALLDTSYTIDVYGIEAEPAYVTEMHSLVQALDLQTRVTFHGTVPMTALPEIYAQHRFILNMASETIDKTMLEALTVGCYPVTTAANARAIGIPAAPETDTPEAIAAFIRTYATQAPLGFKEMYAVVEQRHSLHRLIETMGSSIRSGK